MSIDSSEHVDSDTRIFDPHIRAFEDVGLWETVQQRYLAKKKKNAAEKIFGAAAKRGSVYRWGVAVAGGGPCDEETQLLSRLACSQPGRAIKRASVDLIAASDQFSERIQQARSYSVRDATGMVLWSAALPALSTLLDPQRWSRVLSGIEQARESILQQHRCYLPTFLILGVELGLTLAWRLGGSTPERQLVASSVDALAQWCEQDEESIAVAVSGATETRLVMASFIRSRLLLEHLSGKRLGKRNKQVGVELGTWVAAMTTATGGSAFSSAGRRDLSDDLAPAGLLAQVTELDTEALSPAIAAALGATQSGGRLAWQVDLPETFHHDPHAKLSVMFADWDVRRGRTHVDYSGEDVRIEVFAGRPMVLAGRWQTMIEIDGREQQPCGPWTDACEYSDDDVHYLEIEQPWTADVLLQRQLLLLREDRCLLLADAILPRGDSVLDPNVIRYVSRLPLGRSIEVQCEDETREVFLTDRRPRGLVLPLSGSEWRVGPTDALLKGSQDGHLVLSTEGRLRLYAPLWFDFQRRRLDRKRTWRQLTVADELRIVSRDEAVGYRIQVGSEQWMLYRSLAGRRCRTLLGKHLISDFFASRFDPGDGSHDELLTVDDNDESSDD